MAERLGLKPEFIKTDWRVGADAKVIEEHLREDKAHEIKAVCVVHNETSTGCMSPIAEIRKAIDAAGHPALLMVDTISSLASTDYRHDEWGVDVSIGGAQKGLMLPPGMSFNAVSEKALRASKTPSCRARSFVGRHADDVQAGFFPYTPATQMLYGLIRRSRCCTRKGSTTCLPAITGSARRRAARCVPGVSKCSAAIRSTIRRP